eukprot:974191-Prorocentrum_minimum.AAC.2
MSPRSTRIAKTAWMPCFNSTLMLLRLGTPPESCPLTGGKTIKGQDIGRVPSRSSIKVEFNAAA